MDLDGDFYSVYQASIKLHIHVTVIVNTIPFEGQVVCSKAPSWQRIRSWMLICRLNSNFACGRHGVVSFLYEYLMYTILRYMLVVIFFLFLENICTVCIYIFFYEGVHVYKIKRNILISFIWSRYSYIHVTYNTYKCM